MNPAMLAEASVRNLALEMIDAVDLYVDGVVNDTDIEYLHQYRVNLRKLRSLVSLLKKALPEQLVTLLKARLSLVFRRTNKLRDLDVFLLDEARYRKMLPGAFDEGLSELYALIRKQRQTEQKKVARYLSSKSYIAEIAACNKKLSAPPVYDTNVSAKPILQVVKKLLLNRYQTILEVSSGLSDKSTDEEVHTLRIEIKKFRYLLSFFAEFFPKKSIVPLLNKIKKLQTVLGSFNDYSSQVVFLNGYLGRGQTEMTKSLSGLIAVLYQRQKKERAKVNMQLENFFTESMSQRVDEIFG